MAATSFQATSRFRRASVAWMLVMHAAKTIQDSTDARLLSAGELPMAELRALHTVARLGDENLRPSDLADALGTSRSAASRTCGALERKGLLKRQISAGDRRASVLSLTEEGRRRAERGVGIVKDLRELTFARSLTEEDCEALIRILTSFVNGKELVAEFGPRPAELVQSWLTE